MFERVKYLFAFEFAVLYLATSPTKFSHKQITKTQDERRNDESGISGGIRLIGVGVRKTGVMSGPAEKSATSAAVPTDAVLEFLRKHNLK